MKNKMKYSFLLIASLALASCVQDEALNREAAVDGVEGANVQLVSIDTENKKIDLYVPRQASHSLQELKFTLADQASIEATPQLDTDKPLIDLYDFSESGSRTFTVTSEDQAFHTPYLIRLVDTELPLAYSFDHLLANSSAPYDILAERQTVVGENHDRVLQWVSGNPGYKLTGMAKGREDYPTVQTPDGRNGMCVKLETRTTGSFGMMLNPKMPIAAGNIFVGSFDLSNALKDARKATRFGFPFYQKPVLLSGSYKFKAGEVFTDENGNVVAGCKDTGDIYAALYEVKQSSDFLDGNTSLNSSDIVLMARVPVSETAEWVSFAVPFTQPGSKAFDAAKLRSGKYKLELVCSSSKEGAWFRGAVGSTLYIDDIRLEVEP
ncbi:MAG: PCMD domain-containing protein [Bacteroides sp.]|nr:PCMD domain-containing protein [Bacteroides sp.]